MARGTLYVFTPAGSAAAGRDGVLRRDSLVTADAGQVTCDIGGAECEWSENMDLSFVSSNLKQMLGRYRNASARTVMADDGSGWLECRFLPSFAQEYFQQRFRSFKELAAAADIDAFASDVYRMQHLLEDRFGDMASIGEDDKYLTFDAFVRRLDKDMEEAYILSSAVLLH